MIRRFSIFISRISLTIIFVLTLLFSLFGLAKYLVKNDIHQYVPVRSHLFKQHHYDHHHRELINSNSKTFERMSVVEQRHLLQENRSSTSDSAKIASRPVSIYVHFDLKGAAPKLSYFEQLFPLLHKWGATGICMEYEDMFPYDGIVSSVKHKQAYTKDDIKKINKLAEDNHLDVMPLLQTYGHLEFVLKLEEFRDLRENPTYPQVITPCINKTYTVLFSMIDQYLNLHPNMRLFHIGHDEVYYFLKNPSCEEWKRSTGIQGQYDLFAYHLSIIANYIREKNPNIMLFIWHDVLQNLNIGMLTKNNLINIINPVLWSYREDISVEGFVIGSQADLFGRFKSLWGASAFKGATHEIATISDVRHHYENQVSWIQQLNSYIPTKWKNFDGIILTGWSRYDHFLSLCELLPYSIPSMAFSLAAWKEPFKSLPKSDLFLNKQLQEYVQKELQCSSSVHLTVQEHLSKPVPKCQFPGSEIYESMISVPSIWHQVEQAELFVNKFVTDLHVKYNYIHIKRGEECLEMLKPVVNLLKKFIESFRKSMNEIFPEQVAIEWLETYFMKRFRSVNERYEFIVRALKEQKSWVPRPIPNIDQLDFNQKTKR